MNSLYQKIWSEAKPYYLTSRPMDVKHIEWFIEMVETICQIEKLDESLLMPLAILHDVGYATLTNPKTANYYDKDIRRAHMKAGAEIAEKILKQVKYPDDKSKKIIEYIGIHDNWAFGEVDMYLQDNILGTFKDFDYLWIYTKIGFDAIKIVLKKNDLQMLQHLKDEVSPIHGKKPFSSNYTKELRESYLKEREKDLHITFKKNIP
ncbi:MAG: HD domain-containing protein [Candidatus Roizmanbacteria bacterium]|nr:HD domain-containing protein [Candidatus Roizmanbacteria bacterium]